jgi:hypothetical protein
LSVTFAIAATIGTDCNQNGTADDCEILAGTSFDLNHNGVPDECECIGDLTGDNLVALDDLTQLLSHFGLASGATPADGDLDGDGAVGLNDLALLLSRFGANCG